MFAFGETVTRVRGVTVDDPYSGEDTAFDWDAATELDIPGCGVAAGPTTDPNFDARDMVVSDFTVYAPAGTEVFPSDRVIVRGFACEVVGRPFEWRSPYTGWTPGVVVQANVVEG